VSWALLVLASYLLGAVPVGYLLVRRIAGQDVREVGSGNVGATNVARAAGRGVGLATLAGDLLKGALPVLAAYALDSPAPARAGAAVAAVAGHVYSLFLGFRGGKGVATAAGAMGALAPLPTALAATVFAATLGLRRYVSLASIVGVSSFPVLLVLCAVAGWIAPPQPSLLAAAVLIAALVVVRHRGNLERLRRGTEPRLGRERREVPR